ncbi:hypothetical protein [Mesobacterium pallidum]|uniref:hypothetical protein n=1 Tax=Mesobacterium pallidum TaxID=2872037 RepID=UPI001EE2744B|nr:hypothetical protein [Mesobacterium pallidum]
MSRRLTPKIIRPNNLGTARGGRKIFGRRFFRGGPLAQHPQLAGVADDHELVAAFEQVKAPAAAFGDQPLPPDLLFDPSDRPAHDAALRAAAQSKIWRAQAALE